MPGPADYKKKESLVRLKGKYFKYFLRNLSYFQSLKYTISLNLETKFDLQMRRVTTGLEGLDPTVL